MSALPAEQSRLATDAVRRGQARPEAAATPAVVLGGQLSGLAVTRSLGRRGVPVVVVDAKPDAPAFSSRFAHSAVQVPDPRVDENAAVEALVSLSARLDGGAVVIAASDEWAWAVAAFRDQLAGRFILPPADAATVQRLLDKEQLAALAARAKVATPTTVPVSGRSVDDAVAQVGLPCILKPCRKGDFVERYERGALLVSTVRGVQGWLDELGDRPMVLQEYIPPEAAVLHTAAVLIARDGHVAATFGGRRLAVFPEEFGTSALVASHREDDVAQLAVRILTEAGYRGLAEVEFVGDRRNGSWKLIDVNPRCWKWIGLTTHAGTDLPWLFYLDAIGRLAGRRPVQRPQVRWTSALDLARLPEELRRDVLRGDAGADTVDALMAHDDIEPWIGMVSGGWRASPVACAC